MADPESELKAVVAPELEEVENMEEENLDSAASNTTKSVQKNTVSPPVLPLKEKSPILDNRMEPTKEKYVASFEGSPISGKIKGGSLPRAEKAYAPYTVKQKSNLNVQTVGLGKETELHMVKESDKTDSSISPGPAFVKSVADDTEQAFMQTSVKSDAEENDKMEVVTETEDLKKLSYDTLRDANLSWLYPLDECKGSPPIKVEGDSDVKFKVHDAKNTDDMSLGERLLQMSITNNKLRTAVNKLRALDKELPEDVSGSKEMPEDVAGSKEMPEDVAGSKEMPEDVAVSKEMPEDVAGSKELPEEVAESEPKFEELFDPDGEKMIPIDINANISKPKSVSKVGLTPEVFTNEKQFLVCLDITCFDSENIKIHVKNDMIYVDAEKFMPNNYGHEYRKMKHTFKLTDGANTSNLNVSINANVLSICVPIEPQSTK